MVLTHLAITTEGTRAWAKEKNATMEQAYSISNKQVYDLIELQKKLHIPFLSIYLLKNDQEDPEHFPLQIDALTQLLESLIPIATASSIKITCIGKWYDLPSRLVDAIKAIIDETKNNQKFLVSFCINYKGKEEIVDACRLLAVQVKHEKIELDAITQEDLRENLYQPLIPAPNLIIKNGNLQKIPDFLLFDLPGSTIFFTHELWPEVSMKTIQKAVESYLDKKI